MRRILLVFATVCSLSVPALPQAMKLNQRSFTPYHHVQATADVQTSVVSRYVSVRVHLRNIGGIATACMVEASGQRRITGLSIKGEAEVTFDALPTYKGYTVSCLVS